MSLPEKKFWPTAHDFAEAVQCPAVCFSAPELKGMLPAVDRLGMPLVTSGQFAYVFKLNAAGGGESLAVRCFRGFLGDREERYSAIDAHLAAQSLPALPRFKYLPRGVLVAGQRFPVLVMEWVEGPTLDVYLEGAVGRRDVLRHLADEWLRLVGSLRAAGVAHGDLQHGNIIVERGRLRLVDLDGMYVPALEGLRASEVGHQHYQHPARDVAHFSADTDNFSALVVYLSLVALAERPSLWAEHHDENLLFTRADFAAPRESALLAQIREIGPEHARLAEVLERAALSPDPTSAPPLTELVSARTSLPVWMASAPAEAEAAAVGAAAASRTREVEREKALGRAPEVVFAARPRASAQPYPSTPASPTVQTIFGSSGAPAAAAPGQPADPTDIQANTLWYAKTALGNTYAYIWWLPLHNIILSYTWKAFGITGVGSVLLTFLVLSTAFLLYGFVRAARAAESAGGPHVGGAPSPYAAPRAFNSWGAAPAAPPPMMMATGLSPVVGNGSLMIYHRPGCAWTGKIPAARRQDFVSADAARAAGFRPCHVCAP